MTTTSIFNNNFALLLFSILISCGSSSEAGTSQPPNQTGEKAAVVSVTTSGNENAYRFSVGIQSPDKGCNQYANWWEVVTEDGHLIFRRILGHSHVNEQPFVRSGGTIDIAKDEVVIIRAHMNTSGYGVKTFKGSVANGFAPFTTGSDFASELASQQPLPSSCAF
ncbi:MAG TPA: hypothetical protein ENK46_09070 [Flavobacteriia bacterium]|nr:hypothetical protein [Flavobacteriia bacterium]